jgi:HSP20 family protein
MTTQSAAAMQRVKEPELMQRSREEIVVEFTQMYDVIAQRAFELFENRGRSPGLDVQDWFRAETELLRPVPLNITESSEQYVVRAEVPGFSHDDISISVQPRRLAISGRRETAQHENSAGSIRTEFCADRILRTIDLPSDIDTSRVKTTLRDGMLTVDLPKADETPKNLS